MRTPNFSIKNCKYLVAILNYFLAPDCKIGRMAQWIGTTVSVQTLEFYFKNESIYLLTSGESQTGTDECF